MSRKPFIAGNWKMNMTAQSGEQLIKSLLPLIEDADCDVALCVPAILIPAMTKAVEGTNVAIGAENVHWANSGAFTGEISCTQLKEYGVKYAVIGHSERRQYFGETDEGVNKRTLAALANGITPIVCVGESLEERESGVTDKVLDRQLEIGLCGVEDVAKVVIAYEPIWAIGTGRTATCEQAQDTIAYIRKKIGLLFSPQKAEEVVIQYGGSMNAGNCKALMAMPDVDGGLIGGASLTLDFAKIVNYDK